jgi:CheY-like chemotaxis protein
MCQDQKPVDAQLILVVDDHGPMRECIRTALELNDYRVIEARSGLDGLHILKHLETLPGLIVSDILMDGMDGGQFLESVRAKFPWAPLPFVFVTGAAGQGHKLSARAETGEVACLSKPFRIDELLAAIGDLLPEFASAAS